MLQFLNIYLHNIHVHILESTMPIPVRLSQLAITANADTSQHQPHLTMRQPEKSSINQIKPGKLIWIVQVNLQARKSLKVVKRSGSQAVVLHAVLD